MSKTEELALSRMGTAQPLPELLAEALRVQAENALLRAIVADNRTPVHPFAPVTDEGGPVAERVVTGNDGPAHTPTPGWQDVPSIDAWRPTGSQSGLAILDHMLDVQDARDRAALAAELAKLKGA